VSEGHAFNSSSMFFILLELCRGHSQRLYEIVGQFEAQPDYDCNTAQPKAFIDFVVNQNARIHHKPGSDKSVFADEVGYEPPGSHPLALATTTESVPTDNSPASMPAVPALALAATPAPALTSADITALIQALTAQALTSPPRTGRQHNRRMQSPPPATTPSPIPRCKFCFACGFQRDHNSRSPLCPKMANDPSYTATHRGMVYFPPGTNPLIEGKRANLTCAPGCVPHP